MPTPTYVAIAKSVLTGSQATVTFSGIVNTYTDLLLVVSARTDRASWTDNINVQMNSIAVGSYSQRDVYAYGTSPLSNNLISSNNQFFRFYFVVGANATSNTFSSQEIYIPNYTGSTNKVFSTTTAGENNSGTDFAIGASAGLVSNTAAMSGLTLTPQYGTNFVSGSRFDLYGIKNS
jgi:hypothetical protein